MQDMDLVETLQEIGFNPIVLDGSNDREVLGLADDEPEEEEEEEDEYEEEDDDLDDEKDSGDTGENDQQSDEKDEDLPF